MKIPSLLLAALLITAPAAFAQERPSIVVAAEGVDWLPFEEAVEKAQLEGKKIMIDVFAPWCGYCRRMHVETYADDQIQDYLSERFIATRVNADSSDDTYNLHGQTLTGIELGYHLGARGFPTTVFLSDEAQYLAPLPGFVAGADFLKVLRYIGTDAYETQDFETFLADQDQ